MAVKWRAAALFGLAGGGKARLEGARKSPGGLSSSKWSVWQRGEKWRPFQRLFHEPHWLSRLSNVRVPLPVPRPEHSLLLAPANQADAARSCLLSLVG